ncbi:MAG: hypothetical protein ACREVD_02105 [Burkholderiales bacterium]
MLKKTLALAVLACAALLGATPALADGYRHYHPHKRVVVVKQHVPYYAHYAQRRVIVHRPVHVRPVLVYRQRSSHDVLGGLIVGAMIGAVIASHAGY